MAVYINGKKLKNPIKINLMTIPLLMKYILTSLIAVNLLLGVAYLLFSIDRSEQQLDIDSELININGDKALDKLIVNILFQNGQDEKLRTIFFKEEVQRSPTFRSS